jgi:outer membrane immunogenic protein
MKNILLRSVAFAVVAISGSALAADLPVKARPLPAAAPVFSWTGFYIGANIGWGWANGDVDVQPLPSATTFVNLLPQTLRTKPDGVIGGVQLGYNFQTGPWVFGFETDFQGADMKGTFIESPIIQNNGTPFPGAGNNLTVSQKIDWFGTVRGRLGTTFFSPTFLLYGTGGLAYGRVTGNANTDFRPVGTEAYPASISDTRVGWAAGVGGEWAFAPNWSAKLEYLHIDLGDSSVTANPILPLPPFQVRYTFKTDADIVRFGVNYKIW